MSLARTPSVRPYRARLRPAAQAATYAAVAPMACAPLDVPRFLATTPYGDCSKWAVLNAFQKRAVAAMLLPARYPGTTWNDAAVAAAVAAIDAYCGVRAAPSAPTRLVYRPAGQAQQASAPDYTGWIALGVVAAVLAGWEAVKWWAHAGRGPRRAYARGR